MHIAPRLLVAAILTLAAVACRTETESTTPANELGRFQLVGRVSSVTTGERPEIDLPDASPGSGENTPTEPGVMKVMLRSASNELTSTCGIRRGETGTVWWLTTTRFDPPKVLPSLEDELDDRDISAQGRILGSGASSTGTAPSPSPTASPAAAGVRTTNCVLVADHVEVHQGGGGGREPATTPQPTVTSSPGTLTSPSPATSPGAPTGQP